MQILDLDETLKSEIIKNSIKVIQDWGYTDTGRFIEDYVWRVRYNGETISSNIGKESAIKSATEYAKKHKVDIIYYSYARKSYFKE